MERGPSESKETELEADASAKGEFYRKKKCNWSELELEK
jgi:hypothetical protein